jgi:flagellar hook protein FlgE
MSIQKALNIGLSGLGSNGEALNVIGDNIANMNTIGFKASRAIFQDMLGQTLLGTGSGRGTIGGGVNITNVERLYTQGSLLGTNIVTDLAIAGDGFFVVEGSIAGTSGSFYSRAGRFNLNSEGFLIDPNGLHLQGYKAKADGTIGAQLGSINVNDVPFPPIPSSSIDIVVNLDATTDVDATPFDELNPDTTAHFSAGVTLFDQQGKPYEADVYFQKTANNQWEYHVVVDGKNLEGGTAGDGKTVASGTLDFTVDGKLQAETANPAFTFQPAGAPPQPITFNFGESIAEGGSGTDASSQFAAKSAVNTIEQDGAQSGTFQNLTISQTGKIVGHYSNGKERDIGHLALAKFKSNSGLQSGGFSLFLATNESGTPTLGTPGTGGRGQVRSGALEQSTVDIAHEFTQMIVAQRGYQANSRTITTADAMLQETLNIKR